MISVETEAAGSRFGKPLRCQDRVCRNVDYSQIFGLMLPAS
jgi:hypothetical protein